MANGRQTARWLVSMALLGGCAGGEGSTLPSDGRQDIYGDDDRHEVHEYAPDSLERHLARATAALVPKQNLVHGESENRYQTLGSVYGELMNLCPDQRYYEQRALGVASGVLVGPDLFVTCGHCIPDDGTCSERAVLFGYAYENEPEHESTDLRDFAADDVYWCKEIVYRDDSRACSSDIAVIRLDRPVVSREPVDFRRSGKIGSDDGVIVIGHPEGLPTKIADNATVRSNRKDTHFTANLDVFPGNSGSAVFNASSGLMEGVLICGHGGANYVEIESEDGTLCNVPARYRESRGQAEVHRISRIADLLQELL